MLLRLQGTQAQTDVRVDRKGTLVRGPSTGESIHILYVIRMTNTVFYGRFLLIILFLETLSLISLVLK